MFCSACLVFSFTINFVIVLVSFILRNRKWGEGQEKVEHIPDFNLERAKGTT